MSEETFRKSIALPSWLWFWLIFYIYIFPLQVKYWKSYPKDLLYFHDLLTLSNIPELLPSLAVFLGVTTIFFPQPRAIWLERKFKLNKIDSVLPDLPERTKQIALEIEDFLKFHAPGLQIKVDFHLFDLNSFLYASGYRKTSIALFGGILRLWRSDRKAAESILLHEIGHYRNGDALIIGAGSFFEWVLRYCLIIITFLYLIPTVLVTVYPEITSLYWGVITLKNLLLVTIPRLLLNFLWLLFWIIKAFIPPITGIWCAELNADRFMIKASDSPDAPAKALDRISEDVSIIRWLLSQVSHPPRWFRKWMANETEKAESIVVFLLLFPLAYFITLVEFLIRTLIISRGANRLTDTLGGLANAGTYLQAVSIAWLFSAFFILLWPIIAVYWVRFFSGEVELSNWENYKQYVLSAGIVFCLFAVGHLLT